MERVCSVVPKEYSLMCKNMVDNFGNEFLDYLKKEVNADEVCKAVHVCAAPSPVPAKNLKDNCALCTMVASVLVDQLKVRYPDRDQT